MSFLNELKNQANTLQNQQQGVQHHLAANVQATEAARRANRQAANHLVGA